MLIPYLRSIFDLNDQTCHRPYMVSKYFALDFSALNYASGRILAPSIILLAFAGFYLSGLLNHQSANDEDFYLPLIQHYSSLPLVAPILETTQVHTSIGPLYFIIHRIWSGIVGAGDIQARLLGLGLMASSTFTWYAIGRRLALNHIFSLCLLFLVLPYHAVFSLCALAEPLMMAFLLIAVWLWLVAFDSLQKGTDSLYKWCFCLSGISLGIAENAKQPLVTVAIALTIIGLVRLKNKWSVAGPCLAIAIQIPFWIAWGNIFPPGQRHGMMPQFAQLTGLFPDTSLYLLAVAGLSLWPAVTIRTRSMAFWATCISGILAWTLFGPNLNIANPDRFRFVGPLLHASYQSPVIRSAIILPFLAGWIIFWESVIHLVRNDISIPRQALMLASVLSIIGFINSPLGFDRYATCFLPLWSLAYWPNISNRKLQSAISLCTLSIMAIIMITRLCFYRDMLLQ